MLNVHRKKRFASFPSPAGMSLTKLSLGRNNSVMTSLFPPRESLVVTSRLGTGNARTFFYGVVFPYISPWDIFPLDWGDEGGKAGWGKEVGWADGGIKRRRTWREKKHRDK